MPLSESLLDKEMNPWKSIPSPILTNSCTYTKAYICKMDAQGSRAVVFGAKLSIETGLRQSEQGKVSNQIKVVQGTMISLTSLSQGIFTAG